MELQALILAICSYVLLITHYHLFIVFSPVHRDTKKPRGFTFCQYRRAEDAADAVRGMSGRVSMGREGSWGEGNKYKGEERDGYSTFRVLDDSRIGLSGAHCYLAHTAY